MFIIFRGFFDCTFLDNSTSHYANEVENKVKVSKKVKNEWPSSKGGVIRFAAASNGDGYYLESGQ